MGRSAKFSGIMAFLVTLIVTYPAVVFIGLMLGEYFGVSQSEGAYAMGVAFFFAPVISLITAGAVGVLVGLRTPTDEPPQESGASTSSRLIGTGIGAGVGYALGLVAVWLVFSGQSFDAYWQAWLVGYLPELAMIAGAIAGFIATRSAPPAQNPST